MFNKIFTEIKKFIKENYKILFLFLLSYIVITFPLPYYIHATGGLIDISGRVKIDGEYEKEGSINLSYVTEINGSVITCLLSFIIPHWDLVKNSDVIPTNESYEDADYRNHILLDEANQNATIVAYRKALKNVEIKKKHFIVVYVDENANTDLKVGDELLKVNDKLINNPDDYTNEVNLIKEGDIVRIDVLDKKGISRVREANVINQNNRKVTGILISSKYDYEAIPHIEFNFKESESGPSGGLMMALAIYNKISREDITHGLTIVGTGTIDEDGHVGSISGIEYKLKGAVKAGADIFIAPLDTNYDEAIKLKEKYNYDIKIIGVNTFDEALNYLRSEKNVSY